jgi:hypothetical protein
MGRFASLSRTPRLPPLSSPFSFLPSSLSPHLHRHPPHPSSNPLISPLPSSSPPTCIAIPPRNRCRHPSASATAPLLPASRPSRTLPASSAHRPFWSVRHHASLPTVADAAKSSAAARASAGSDEWSSRTALASERTRSGSCTGHRTKRQEVSACVNVRCVATRSSTCTSPTLFFPLSLSLAPHACTQGRRLPPSLVNLPPVHSPCLLGPLAPAPRSA